MAIKIVFYEKLGMKLSDDVMQYNKIEWNRNIFSFHDERKQDNGEISNQ